MNQTGRPKPEFQERHFDYAMRPDEYPQLQTIVAGQKLTVPFQFDYDAPFVLRSRALRIPYNVVCKSDTVTEDLRGLKLRFSDSTRQYRQQNHIRQTIAGAYYGQWGLPIPVYPGILFPPGSTLLVDIHNDGSTTISNLTLYWRGVKLFPWGQRPGFTYPAKFSTLPYSYTIVPPSDSNPIGGLLNLPVTATLNNQVFKLQDDADFVIRAGQAGIPSATDLEVFEIFFKLYDADHYPYSNFPIHMDVLFGNLSTGAIFTYNSGNSNAAPYGAGPIAPGLFYPEVYLPKTRLMYYDVVRSDGAITCAETVTYPVVFHGSKVFPQ